MSLRIIAPDALRTIHTKLQGIAVPNDMERKPRSLEYIKRWKGKIAKITIIT